MDFQDRKEITIILENEDDIGTLKYIMEYYLERNSMFEDDADVCNFAKEIRDYLPD